MAREACAAHPPASREPTPVRGVALVLGGQNPITLEYQIYPPPIDALVTGMASRAPDPCWPVGEWREQTAFSFQ